jgi:Zn-dependent metalloprotease
MSEQYSNDQDNFLNELISNEILKNCSKENMALQQCVSVNQLYNGATNNGKCVEEHVKYNDCVKNIKSIQKIMHNCKNLLQNYQSCIMIKQKEYFNETDEEEKRKKQLDASKVCFKELNELRKCSLDQLK